MSSAPEPSLVVERDGPAVVLTMNRPEQRNALSLDMLVRLADAWDDIEADATVRAAILTGAGGHSCTGGGCEMLQQTDIRIAEEALRWGLVTHVVPTGEGLAKAKEIAALVAAAGPISVATTKASAIETGWLPEDEARTIENEYTAKVTKSDDAKEGVRAFVEKRTPSWTGT
ncbi:MAG: enoyl-CoA hydratase-related protein [Acidimicrobiia bacterium]|jgi:enoyl-CoA hydratase/carnithine racemase